MKERTLALPNHSMTLTKEERAKQFHPFVVAIDALLEGAYTLICSKAPENDHDRRAITHYCRVLKETEVNTWKDRPKRILSDWRWRTGGLASIDQG